MGDASDIPIGGSSIWPNSMYSTMTRVIGVPLHYGQGKPGVASGPKRMRQHGMLTSITDMGFKIHDTGDIEFKDVPNDPTFSNIKRPRAVGLANKQISKQVSSALERGGSVLTLGGDHSLAIGSVTGQAEVQPDFGVIWVDAHADLNPPLASGSGNVHGMPLAFLIHELQDLIPKDIPEFDWIRPCLHTQDVAYIGLRDLDQAEKVLIEKYNMAAYTMHDVNELGIAKVVQLAIDAVSKKNTRPIHLSFDIDGLDPMFAPSTGTPVPGGLSLREGVYITEKVASTGLLSVMDMVEVNPELGTARDQETTLQSASEIVQAWYGHRIRSQIKPNYRIPLP